MTSGNDPKKKNSPTPSPKGTPTEGGEAATQAMLTKVDVLHALVDEYKARDDQNARFQRRNFWLGVGTAAIVFLYTAIAALQWQATREAVQLTAQSLAITREGMRADLVASGMGLVRRLAPGENVVNVSIKNTGPTKATRLGVKWHDWVCSGPPSESCQSQCPFFRAVYTVEGPGSLGRDLEQDFEVRFSIPTPEEAHAIRDGDKTLYVCGMVGYADVFRNHYEEILCGYYRSDDGRFMMCFSERSGY